MTVCVCNAITKREIPLLSLTYFAIHWFSTALVIGLKLETVSIPQYGMRDGSVTLGCYFDLEKDTLLVLKWYKDGHEFFRYSIQTAPPILTFPVQGVLVEVRTLATALVAM
jgi:hypothetical protein